MNSISLKEIKAEALDRIKSARGRLLLIKAYPAVEGVEGKREAKGEIRRLQDYLAHLNHRKTLRADSIEQFNVGIAEAALSAFLDSATVEGNLIPFKVGPKHFALSRNGLALRADAARNHWRLLDRAERSQLGLEVLSYDARRRLLKGLARKLFPKA